MSEVTNLSWVVDHSLGTSDSDEMDLDRIHAEVIGSEIKNKWNVKTPASAAPLATDD